jgi:hypothetical protein
VPQRRIAIHRSIDDRVVDLVQFQRKEQQIGAWRWSSFPECRRRAWHSPDRTCRPNRRGRQGQQAADQFFERLIFPDSRDEAAMLPAPFAASSASLPFQRRSKAAARSIGKRQVCRQFRRCQSRDTGQQGSSAAVLHPQSCRATMAATFSVDGSLVFEDIGDPSPFNDKV